MMVSSIQPKSGLNPVAYTTLATSIARPSASWGLPSTTPSTLGTRSTPALMRSLAEPDEGSALSATEFPALLPELAIDDEAAEEPRPDEPPEENMPGQARLVYAAECVACVPSGEVCVAGCGELHGYLGARVAGSHQLPAPTTSTSPSGS